MGSIAHRWGARRLLWVGGLAIVPMSGLWLVSDNFLYLVLVQAAAGAAWAGYELAMFLLFFEAIPAEERTSVLTTYNLAYAVSSVAGSLVGGSILAAMGRGHVGYMAVFGLSFAVRAITVLFLRRVPDGSQLQTAAEVPTRTLAVRPADGSIATPILPARE
jgi:MFS family permease